MAFFEYIQTQTQADQTFREMMEIGIFLQQGPIKPTDLIILAVGVVITALRPAHFVPINSMGTPKALKVIVRKFLIWRTRVRSISGSSVGPSTPKFQLEL